MYEKEIGEVRKEIEDARKYLEELTAEVMIRKLRDGTGNIFISFSAARKWRGAVRNNNSICISPPLIILTAATVNLNCRIRGIPTGQQAQSQSYLAFSV